MAFARLANGNVKQTRILMGQTTKLSRTMHGLYYDAMHDEMVVPVALAGAILTFHGGAEGAEAPIRVLQGPRTRIMRPDTVYVDTKNDELYAPSADGGLLVFPRTATGDVPPKRVIAGPKTKLSSPDLFGIYGIAVDPVRNLVAVANRYAELGDREGALDGVLVFDRTANGDVAPRGIIRGKNSRITRLRQIEVDPERGLLFVSSRGDREGEGILGVWNITDNGDVPPKLAIRTASSGVAINPRAAEVYSVSGRTNGLTTYILPELFKGAPQRSAAKGGGQ
jgi:DNA-binding beta-propeller fold protein YncE